MDEDIFENIDSPNSSAYEKFELRDGIPLVYVQEKLISSIKSIHRLYSFVRDNIKDDMQLNKQINIEQYSPKNDGLLSPLYSAFRHGITSLLALQNMLAITNNQEIFEKLLAFNEEDFSLWLQRIQSEGSLNG